MGSCGFSSSSRPAGGQEAEMGAAFDQLAQAVISGNSPEAQRLTRAALDAGASAEDALNQGLLPGMEVVGGRFRGGEMFIPEVLRSAKAMGSSMELLRPLLTRRGASRMGTVVIGTAEGDLHDIGKSLVAMMLEGAGFRIIDLGVDIKPARFVEAVVEHEPDIIGMSALLTTTMPRMAETIMALSRAGVRERVKVMVGGAPLTAEFARRIGADGYASNAVAAVEKARQLVGARADLRPDCS